MKTNTHKAPFILKIMSLILAMGLITGCAGKAAQQKSDASSADKATTDITRPPSFVKRTNQPESESNPDETVSYDEWLKRREDGAEQVDADTDSSPELEEPEEPTKIP